MHILTYHNVNGAAYNPALNGIELPLTREIEVAVATIQGMNGLVRRDSNASQSQPYSRSEHWQTTNESSTTIEIPDDRLPVALRRFVQ